MKLKIAIASFFLVNFWLLISDSRYSWKISSEYTSYLENLGNTTYHQNIANQENYCKIVSRYQLSNPAEKVIFSDIPPDFKFKSELGSHYTIVNPEQHIGMDQVNSPYRHLDPKITLFLTALNTWHKGHVISKHFLCEGQIYNHIVGSSEFNMHSHVRSKVKNYKVLNMWNRIIGTYDLSVDEECREFVETLDGYWTVKVLTSKGKELEVSPKTIEAFKTAAGNGEKCPFPNRYAQRNMRTVEFALHCYMLIFTNPFRVYFTVGYAELFSFSEYIMLDKLIFSISEKVYAEIVDQVKITMYHFAQMNRKLLLLHPRTFELFSFKFLVDHKYFPWLSEAQTMSYYDYKNPEVYQILRKLHINTIEFAFSELLGLQSNSTNLNYFRQIF